MSEVENKQKANDLKSLHQQLEQIIVTLDMSRDNLEYVVTGKGHDVEKSPRSDTPTLSSVTLSMLMERIDVIGSKANAIKRYVDQLTGN